MIDDSVEVLDALRRYLESEGVAVVGVASNGSDGVRAATELDPDVILLDIDLGDESGFEVARLLASAGVSAHVIMISAHPEYGDFALDAPAAGFLSKAELSRESIDEIIASSRPDGDQDGQQPGA